MAKLEQEFKPIELKDYGFESDLNDDLTVKESLVNDFKFTEALQFDQEFEGVPLNKILGNIGQLRTRDPASGSLGFTLKADGSVDIGTMFFNRQFTSTFFESFDGWVGILANSGARTAGLGGGRLQTGATGSSFSGVGFATFGSGSDVDFDDKNPMFEIYIQTSATTNQSIAFGVGSLSTTFVIAEAFDFKVSNNTLTASTVNGGVETSTTISGITLTNMNRYKAVMNSFSNTVKFYVNGNLVATHTTNIPTGISTAARMRIQIANGAAENKEVYMRSAIFAQDL